MGVILSWPVAAALACALKKRIEDVAMLGIAILSLAILLPSLFLNIDVGIYTAVIIGFLGIIYCAYSLVKDRSIFFANAMTPGGLVFAALILFFAVTNYGRGILGTDDMHYWGRILKGFYYCGDIRFDPAAIHPANMLLWADFAEKTSLRYSDGIALWAVDVMMISLLIPILRFADGKKAYLKGLSLGIVILLFPLSLWSITWERLLGDGIQSVAVGAMAASVYMYFVKKEKIFFYQILVELYFITSTKRIGILASGCMIFVVLFIMWQNGDGHSGKEKSKNIKKTVAIILCPVITYFLWLGVSAYLLVPIVMAAAAIAVSYIYNKRNSIIAKILILLIAILGIATAFMVIKKILMVDELSWNSTTNYVSAFLTTHEVGWGDTVSLSLGKILILLAIIAFVTNAKITSDKSSVFLSESIVLIIAILVFNFALCVTYATTIVEANDGFGQYVPGIERYILGGFFSTLMLVAFWFLDDFAKRYLGEWGIVAVLIIVIITTNLGYFSDYVMNKSKPVHFYGFETAGIKLTPEDKIYFILEIPNDVNYDEGAAFIYDMAPVEVSARNEFHYATLNNNGHEYITAEQFQEILRSGGFDYVYIQSVDEEFMTLYGDMIEGSVSNVAGSVYAVRDDDNVCLVPIH